MGDTPTKNSETRQYKQRDVEELDVRGGYYWRHINAMTAEGLHAKSDIAAELAWRDAEIDHYKMMAESNTRAPERGEGQERGVDTALKIEIKRVHDAVLDERVERFGYIADQRQSEWAASHEVLWAVMDRVVSPILSRQSAVGVDWDGEAALLDTLLYAQGHGISNDAHSPGTPPTDILDDYEQSIPKGSESYRQSLRAIRRALSATRTPEGDWDEIVERRLRWIGEVFVQVDTDEETREQFRIRAVNQLELAAKELEEISTPPPRPTATGGITVEMRQLIQDAYDSVCDDCTDSEHALEPLTKLRALIERAGEQETGRGVDETTARYLVERILAGKEKLSTINGCGPNPTDQYIHRFHVEDCLRNLLDRGMDSPATLRKAGEHNPPHPARSD